MVSEVEAAGRTHPRESLRGTEREKERALGLAASTTMRGTHDITIPTPVGAQRRESGAALSSRAPAPARAFVPTWMRALAAVLAAVTLAGCAAFGTSDPVVVRAEDVRIHSLAAYKEVVALHMEHSTEETPAIYRQAEQLRTKFPAAHRGLVAAIDTYKAAKAKDPAALHAEVLRFLEAVEKLGPDDWKERIRFIRALLGAAPGRVG